MTAPIRPPRAAPLTVEDRRAMIIEVVTPLLAEYGRDVTTKQIADAAGIAEGTIFRAFGDKETLIQAVLEKQFDPEPLNSELNQIDLGLSLEEKVHIVIALVRNRFGTVFRMVAALGFEKRRHETHTSHWEFDLSIARVLEPHAAELRMSPDRVAHLLRLVAVATSFPKLNQGAEFTLDELTNLVLHGVTSAPPSHIPG